MKIFLLFFTILLNASILKSQIRDFLVTTKNRTTIAKLDYLSKSTSEIYSSNSEFIHSLKTSFDSRYISFIEQNEDLKKYLISTQLKIVDPTGTVLIDQDSVLKYSWNPKSNKIACLIGTQMIEEIPIAVYLLILDLEKNTSSKVWFNKLYPYLVQWINNDQENAIYFRSADNVSKYKVMRYNLTKIAFEPTPYFSFDFSPDGLYYAVSGYDGINFGGCSTRELATDDSCFGIYKTASNKKVGQFSLRKYGTPKGWVYNEGHLFLFNQKSEPVKEDITVKRGDKTYNTQVTKYYKKSENFVYDVKTQELVQQFSGIPYKQWVGKPEYLISMPVQEENAQSRTSDNVIVKTIPEQYKKKKD